MDFITSPDFIAGFLSLLFTILILSYVVGDNPAFRLAIHAFIGVSAGYVTAVVLLQVIANQVLARLSQNIVDLNVWIPTIFGVVLLTKLSPRIEWIGRPVVAFLVGTGAAAAVAGAMMGTLYPQVAGSIDLVGQNLPEGFLVLLGTVITLAYFQFSVRGKNAASGQRGGFMNILAFLGQVFIAITLGALLAGALSAALTALVDRIQSIVLFLDHLMNLH